MGYLMRMVEMLKKKEKKEKKEKKREKNKDMVRIVCLFLPYLLSN
jgi:hypothetical protein